MTAAPRARRRGGVARRALFVSFVPAFAATCLAGAARGQPAAQDAAAARTARPAAVAIAPFANLSGNPAHAWLGAGITETVAADLDRIPALMVVGGGSLSRGAAGSQRSAPAARAAARALGAAWVVAGGFEQIGRRVWVTARILDVETGVVRRIVTVDGEAGEPFALQDRMSGALRDGFAEILSGAEGGGGRKTAAGAPAAEAPRAATDDDALPPDDPARPAGAAGGPDLRGGAAAGRSADPGPAAPRRRLGGAFGAVPAPPGSMLPESALPDPPRPARRRSPEAPPVATSPEAFAPAPSLPDAAAFAGAAGALVIDAGAPQFGVAAGAGILTGRPMVRPPRTPAPPTIDGRLDDAAWTRAAHITEFVQLAPRAGAPASEASDVYVTYDGSTLYLGFHAHFSDPETLRANRKDRDVRTGDDVFWVYFDPFLDQQRAYSFGVNAYGVQLDAIVSTRSGGGFGGRGRGAGIRLPFGDASWDALFDSAGRIVADGFTAEMAIPFKSLRYPRRAGAAPHQWGFQVARRIPGKNETAVWAPVTREIAGFLPQMGVIEGMTGLSTSRNVEILPTFTAVQLGALDDAGSFADDDVRPEGGVNFKYGVTSNLTADVTFNPDFSQIESDRPQIEVNQRFALFYPELRPFFLEGAEIFNVRAPVRIVHTRTIVDPRYGAKLTGKVGRTTIGVMYANDESPAGLEDDDAAAAIDPSAQTFVGRVRYDLYAESFIGATFTDRELLGGFSRVAGLDSNFRLGNTHEIGIRAFGSRHRDVEGVETSGHLLNANVRKRGRSFSYLLAAYSLSPDFRTDVGFVWRTDQRWTYGEVEYRWWPEHWLTRWGPRLRYSRSYNFDGVLEDEQASAGVNFAFADGIDVNGDVRRDMERFGGIDFFKSRYRFFAVVTKVRRLSFGMGGNGGDQIFFDEENPYLGRDTGWSGFANLRLIPRLESRINVDTNRFVDVRGGDALVFDVNIFRTLTTYQFTDRLLLRNISEYNSFDRKLSLNFLFTYRVNAGTVFYVGYDDRYQQADRIVRDRDGDGVDDRFFHTTELRRTNRALFTKLQYLFRY